jgi:hypothetical protein
MNPFRRRETATPSSSLDPHQWHHSKAEFQVSSKHPKTIIPDPDIFRDVIIPAFDQASNGAQLRYPNPGHIAVHLALVECFVKLKEKVTTSAELKILDTPQYESDSRHESESPPADSARILQRWNTTIRLAVARFAVWFANIEGFLRHATAYHRFGSNINAHHAMITPNYLPPLDVLLVWYAYMNNPSEYRSDNVANQSPQLLEIPLPWEAILEVIDIDAATYNLPPAAVKLFSTITAQNADILLYLTQPPPYSDQDPQTAFSLDLAEAIHQLTDEDSFIQRMHAFLWLRAPSLEGTLSRALAYYGMLPQAVGNRQSRWLERVNIEPTLELVWRTHMLYPGVFAAYNDSCFGENAASATGNGLEEFPMDVKFTNIDSSESSSGSEYNENCYCWACERVKDEIPDYVRSVSRIDSNGERSNTDRVDPSLSLLTKDQLFNIKADLAFHYFVENFRQHHQPGTTLPTRPPTAHAIRKQKHEQESKDRAGRYRGVGYTVEVIRLAVYDKQSGKLRQKEKTKVERSENMSTTGRLGRWSLY